MEILVETVLYLGLKRQVIWHYGKKFLETLLQEILLQTETGFSLPVQANRQALNSLFEGNSLSSDQGNDAGPFYSYSEQKGQLRYGL
ncbi:UNVERIFIED_CONTAM: hypothetical protein Sradi_2595900 [Sesamum radiatum]|uniref:Uncharacterized protein n=1 Tax=Sesamum radiatum TaxID=300843 RepID=A0AAW2S3P3_SESRA